MDYSGTIFTSLGALTITVLTALPSKILTTFGSSSPVLEVNVFGKNHNFYNKNIKVLFIDFIRKEKKFKNSAMLVRQIKKDIKVAKISLNKNNVRN